MKKHHRKIGALVSGGLDSAALINHLLKKGFQVWPVYVSCGLRWEKTELYWLKKFLFHVRSTRLKPLRLVYLHLENAYRKNWSRRGNTPGRKSPDEAVFLPARNLLLIVKSLLYLSSMDVYVMAMAMATLKGNPFPDAQKITFCY